MYTFFLVVHALVAAILVVVILMQQSEGGGLVGGGNSGGLMTARGAANFLTRATTILATMFVSLSIALAAIAIADRAPAELDTSLTKSVTPALPTMPTSAVPMAGATDAPPPTKEAPAFPQKPDLETKAAVPTPTEKPAKSASKPSALETKPANAVAAEAKPETAKVAPPPVAAPTGNSSQ